MAKHYDNVPQLIGHECPHCGDVDWRITRNALRIRGEGTVHLLTCDPCGWEGWGVESY